jgi:cytochrome c
LSMYAYRRLFIVAAAVVAPALCAASSKPNAENGKTTFTTMCGVCHSVQKEGGPTLGPNLLGIVGRKAATDPDFPQYTVALKDSRITWNKKHLDKFLLNPNAKVPGTAMPMQIQDDKIRADVIAYLLTLKKK